MEPLDDLDRALFALPLEEPPPSLRAAILAGVAAASPAMRPWEVVAVGVAFAVLTWRGIVVAVGGASALVTPWAGAFVQAMSDATVLFWLTAGATTALWLSLLSLAPAHTKLAAHR